MKRRCDFLDCLPSYNYNQGGGEYLPGSEEPTSTRQLGSTLMDTMLSEVSDFCDPDIKKNWSHKARKSHQQVWTLNNKPSQFFPACNVVPRPWRKEGLGIIFSTSATKVYHFYETRE